jgi:hypothetical protein
VRGCRSFLLSSDGRATLTSSSIVTGGNLIFKTENRRSAPQLRVPDRPGQLKKGRLGCRGWRSISQRAFHLLTVYYWAKAIQLRQGTVPRRCKGASPRRRGRCLHSTARAPRSPAHADRSMSSPDWLEGMSRPTAKTFNCPVHGAARRGAARWPLIAWHKDGATMLTAADTRRMQPHAAARMAVTAPRHAAHARRGPSVAARPPMPAHAQCLRPPACAAPGPRPCTPRPPPAPRPL